MEEKGGKKKKKKKEKKRRMENTQGGPASRAMLTVAILLLVFCEKKWNSEFGSGGETDGDQNLRLVAGLFMVPIVEGVACEIVGISR